MTMKVKYANGVESHVAPAIGNELVKAGIATVVEAALPGTDGEQNAAEINRNLPKSTKPRLPKPGDHVKAAPEWEVGPVSLNTRSVVAIKMTIMKNVTIFTGEPERMPPRIGGWPVPKDVADSYRREYKNNRGLQDEFAKYHAPEPDRGNIEAGETKRRVDAEMKEGVCVQMPYTNRN
jgi:hypothetical protein